MAWDGATSPMTLEKNLKVKGMAACQHKHVCCSIVDMVLQRQVYGKYYANNRPAKKQAACPYPAVLKGVSKQHSLDTVHGEKRPELMIRKLVPRRLQIDFDSIMTESWRRSNILLGFSSDGNYIVTYSEHLGAAKFWRFGALSPDRILLQMNPFTCPLPNLSSGPSSLLSPSGQGQSNSNKYQIFQSSDSQLTVLVGSKHFLGSDETKQFVYHICPGPLSAAGASQAAGCCSFIEFSVFSTNPFPEFKPDQIVVLGQQEYLVVINTGDSIRTIHLKIEPDEKLAVGLQTSQEETGIDPSTNPSRLEYLKRVSCWGETPQQNGYFLEQQRPNLMRLFDGEFPEHHYISGCREFWDSGLDPLHFMQRKYCSSTCRCKWTETSESHHFNPTQMENKYASTSRSCGIKVLGDHHFDAESFLSMILVKYGFTTKNNKITDYDIRIIKILDESKHILISSAISLVQSHPEKSCKTFPLGSKEQQAGMDYHSYHGQNGHQWPDISLSEKCMAFVFSVHAETGCVTILQRVRVRKSSNNGRDLGSVSQHFVQSIKEAVDDGITRCAASFIIKRHRNKKSKHGVNNTAVGFPKDGCVLPPALNLCKSFLWQQRPCLGIKDFLEPGNFDHLLPCCSHCCCTLDNAPVLKGKALPVIWNPVYPVIIVLNQQVADSGDGDLT